MQCPRCVVRLVQARQAGIPVDRCPRCGGTWLDRGELARISARQWQLRHEWIPEGERSRPLSDGGGRCAPPAADPDGPRLRVDENGRNQDVYPRADNDADTTVVLRAWRLWSDRTLIIHQTEGI